MFLVTKNRKLYTYKVDVSNHHFTAGHEPPPGTEVSHIRVCGKQEFDRWTPTELNCLTNMSGVVLIPCYTAVGAMTIIDQATGSEIQGPEAKKKFTWQFVGPNQGIVLALPHWIIQCEVADSVTPHGH